MNDSKYIYHWKKWIVSLIVLLFILFWRYIGTMDRLKGTLKSALFYLVSFKLNPFWMKIVRN